MHSSSYSYIRLAHLRIRYAPREYYKRYAHTLWAARMRYAICEYATGRANTIRHTRIRYGPRGDMRRVTRAMSNCKVAFSATITTTGRRKTGRSYPERGYKKWEVQNNQYGIAHRDQVKSFTARNGETTWQGNCFLKPFMQRR